MLVARDTNPGQDVQFICASHFDSVGGILYGGIIESAGPATFDNRP